MPHRRRAKKNSFGGHFDDLVKHFPEQLSKGEGGDEGAPNDEPNFHDRLFKSAWNRRSERGPEG
ncbi:MAG TPA: hypothetical protein VHS33_04740 [Sphingomicrobium sp.]|nr:hypothetical protein [Sphingomicrobium sp.]